jgi:aspartyl-tRNA(Asn)/glutamyl-tRNA(Gln) amidotransferase subunit A
LNCSGVDLEPAVRSAFDNAVQAISRAGFAVQGCALPGYDFAAMRRKGLLVCEAELAASLGEDAHAPNAISPELASLLAFADRQSATKLAQCYLAFRTLDAPLHALFESVDVIVTPTAPQRAFPHSQSAPANQADLTALANLAGLPAATLPLPIANDGGGDGGLPVGLHMMAPRGRDDMLLQLARRFSDICGQT